MALFKRGADKKKKTQQTPAPNPEAAPERRTARAMLSSARMAEVYSRTYCWMFSVSLDFDSYQIESGVGRFPSGEFPLRGYYSRLCALLREQTLEEQREEFEQTFSPKALSAAFAADRTCVCGLIYARLEEPGDDGDAEENEGFDWYELRAERIPVAGRNLQQFLLYVRRVKGERDDGRLPRMGREVPRTQDGGYDWAEIRAERLLNSDRCIYYEYNVAEDKLYVHRRRGDKQIDREEGDFLSALDVRGNWMVSQEHTDELKRLFRSAIDGIAGEAEILYRKDGMQGANFIHYRIVCSPLEERGKPTWLFGSLEDVEEKVRKREQERDIMLQMENLLKNLYSSMYQIDMNRKQIYRILCSNEGFYREKTGTPVEVYLRRQIDSGVISKESAKLYLSWLQPGYLQHKAERGSYEFEAQLRLTSDAGYRWYSEMITAVEDRPGLFMRLRRDVTDTHELRAAQFEMAENSHMAEYSRSVLDTIANLVEFRNIGNSTHIAHVRQLTRMLLTDIAARSPQYQLAPRTIDLYAQASTMHDIGKITIPDSILNKPGRYTPEEYDIMKTHTTTGAQIVDQLEMRGLQEMKDVCRDVVLHHHERYDGTGYPEGRAGDEISIGVQAVSLADVYDALVSVRCYKDAIDFDEAREMILTGRCGQFNPRVLESFKAVEPAMRGLYVEQPAPSEVENAAAQGLLRERGLTEESSDA